MNLQLNRILKSIVIVSIIISSGCQKDSPEVPDNPLNGKTSAIFNPKKKYGTVTDVDGNIYKTIRIGNLVWMAENLRTIHYRNGDEILNVKDNDEWTNLYNGAYCNYNNTNNPDTIATFGRLYNWYATNDDRNLAPKGWHVSTFGEWLELINYLGGDSVAADKLKEAGELHWHDPYLSTNSSGFTALPGGDRYRDENMDWIGYDGLWWSSTEYNEGGGFMFYMFAGGSKVYYGGNYKNNGYSIRCVKDY
ncbi:MAG TPA: fibrobacter succinogenes major paralogous domain-containing protein [Bacteroidales bacterium]|nr:fibrobacter succinogenes major paralogous domain-containing protein [Bacteroidales bacterium]